MSDRRIRRPAVGLLVLVLLCAATAHTQEHLGKLQAEYTALYERVRESVVALSDKPLEEMHTTGLKLSLNQASEADCGFVIEGGYVVTDVEPVMFGARNDPAQDPLEALKSVTHRYAITADGMSMKCEVVGYDLRNLLLVLKLPEHAPIKGLPIGDSSLCSPGTLAASLGNGFDSIIVDHEVGFSVGSVSDLHRFEVDDYYNKEEEFGDPYRGNVLAFEGAAHPGDYGGPLVNFDGEVIGMITGHFLAGKRLATAVPSAQFKPSLDAIVAGKPLPQASLGFSAKNSSEDKRSDYTVTRVVEGGPAEQAGLKVGDVLYMMDGERIKDRERARQGIGLDYEAVMTKAVINGMRRDARVLKSYGLPPGAVMSLLVKRGDRFASIELNVGIKDGVSQHTPRATAVTKPSQALSQVFAHAAHLASRYVVHVIVDRVRTPAGGRRQSMPGMMEDPVFFDASIGPYSGVVVGSDGLILVSDAMLGPFVGAERKGRSDKIRNIFVALADGRTFAAEILGRHQAMDLALLKIPVTGLDAVDMASFRSPRRGESLSVVTRSLNPFRHGCVSGICSAEVRENGRAFQFDSRIGHSDFGGLIVDDQGTPLGMVTLLNIRQLGQASGVAYGASGESISAGLASLKQGEFTPTPPTPFLGVMAAPAFANRPGLQVSTVTPGSGAAIAGLREGDIILSADDKELHATIDLVKIIQGKKVGDTLALVIERGEERIAVTATLKSRD